MDKKLNKSLRILTLTMIIVLVLTCVTFTVFDYSLDNLKANNSLDNNITVEGPLGFEVTYPNTGEYGQFKNGTKYVYTDKNKIDGFRSGTINDKYGDLSKVEVDTTQSHGSQKNPYVIATLNDWEFFVRSIAVDANHGSGNYYVLANDLDFSGQTFYPVAYFKGSFYGMGRTLKNINCNNWVYWNGSQYVSIGSTTNAGFAVFCKAENALISDLIISDVIIENMPNVAAPDIKLHGPFPSGLIGISYGSVTALNVHVSGELRSTTTYSNHTRGAGIVAMQRGSVYIYRCSADMTMSYSSSQSILFGGIVGQLNGSGSVITYIYDCVANVIGSGSGSYNHSAISIATQSNNTSVIENIVGTVDIISNSSNANGGGLGISVNTFSVKNMFVDAKIGSSSSNQLSLTAIGGAGTYQNGVSTMVNIHQVKSTSDYASIYTGKDVTALLPSERTEHNSLDSLNQAAKAEVGNHFSASIWDVDKIGGSYAPDDSPVRNYLVAFVDFRHLHNYGDSEEKVGLDDGEPYVVGDKLPDETSDVTAFTNYINTKASDNHVFVGWTDDATGNGEPFTELPRGLFGEVTLYAVWSLPDSYVKANIKTNLTLDKDKIEYDSVESITLTALVTHTEPSSGGMTKAKPTYYFIQDGEEKTITANAKNSGVLEVKTVKDSGEYTFKYRLTDSKEPLWYYVGTHTTGKSIEIEKGKLTSMTLEDFKIDADTIPYYGKPLKLVEFSCVVKNKAGIEVLQESHKWEYQEVEKVAKGTNNTTIVIVPADEDNYESSYTFDVEFESQALTIVFDMQSSISRELAVDVTYGQNYGAAEIIYLFQRAFMKALESGDRAYELVKNMAPYLDNAPITPDANGLPIYNGEFNGINKIERIKVTFEEVSYKVTFKYNDKNGTPDKEETYRYGQYLKKPSPNPTNEDLLFVGWYFDEISIDESGDEVTTTRAWRFNSVGDIPQDRVSGELTLTAKWLKADTLDSIKVEVDSSKKFTAQTKIGEDDLVVTAYYSGVLDGITVKQDVVLNWSQFKVKYATTDELLHVTDGGYEVTVSYQFGSGEPKEASVKINVLPITISTDKLT
ncbi:MAG: InlB B-repeat-containing protein, partial [Clostridia bacterium]|nr:InlB B-repeat-containing protein [Clostridia bacterium]